MSGDDDLELDDVEGGYVNGDIIDDADPNSAVVGVDVTSGAGNDASVVEPVPSGSELDDGAFDPGAHTVDDVNAYLEANPDDAARVLEAERVGRNRVGITGGD